MPRIARYLLGVVFVLVCGYSPAHAAPPTLVQSIACETAGTSTTCTPASSVTSGDLLVWWGEAGFGTGVPVLTVSDNCGGIYTTVDSGTKGGTQNTVGQGYALGSHGSCIITFSGSNTPTAVTGIVFEITPAVLDVHSFLSGQSVSAGGTVTTPSVTTTATDYAISFAIDAAGTGSAPTVAAPFTVQRNNSVFGESGADFTQSSSGAVTATWTIIKTTADAVVGMMTFSASGGGGGGGNNPTGVWSFGYYTPGNNTSHASSSNLSTLQWTALTHVTLFGAGPASNGTIQFYNSSAWATAATNLVTAAHSHGVKALVSITSANGSFTNAFNTQNSLATLISNIMTLVNNNNFDGVDIDMEEGWNQTLMNNLLSGLRTSLGSKLLTAFANDSQFNWAGPPTPVCSAAANGWTSTQIGFLDRLNLGAYDLANPGNGDPYTWFNSALLSDASQFLWSGDYLAKAAVNCGVSASKLNLGIPFYGDLYTANNAPRQATGGGATATQEPYSFILTNFTISSPTYDTTAHNEWKAQSGSSYLTWDDPQAVTDKVNYVYANSLGGWFVYALGWDGSDCSISCPLLSTINADIIRSGPPFSLQIVIAQ